MILWIQKTQVIHRSTKGLHFQALSTINTAKNCLHNLSPNTGATKLISLSDSTMKQSWWLTTKIYFSLAAHVLCGVVHLAIQCTLFLREADLVTSINEFPMILSCLHLFWWFGGCYCRELYSRTPICLTVFLENSVWHVAVAQWMSDEQMTFSRSLWLFWEFDVLLSIVGVLSLLGFHLHHNFCTMQILCPHLPPPKINHTK